MMLNRFIWVCLLGIILWQCGPGPATSELGANGLTPEATLRQYQAYVDRNHFEGAKKLSTPAERFRLDELATVLAGDKSNASVFRTDFLKVDCKIKGNYAFCHCVLRDEFEKYEALFKLSKVEDNWLVDAPEKNFKEEDKVIDELLQEYKMIMN